MTTWCLLAPGPSASASDAARVRASSLPVGAVGNAFELVADPAFVASSDRAWWRKYPAAMSVQRRYCMSTVPDVDQVRIPPMGSVVNSGVLALECAKRLGATRILLLGFDMRGSHFFGQYTNGLRNTAPHQRQQHMRQYAEWARLNKAVEVVNCTAGSALACFPARGLDACLAELEAQRSCAA